MKRALTLAVTLLLVLPAPAFADDSDVPSGPAVDAGARPIDLATAIATALRQNDTVLGEAVDVDVAAAQVRALQGADDFVIEGEIGGLTRATEPVEGPFFQETDLDAFGASLGLWKPLSTGGRVGLTFRDDIARTSVRVAGAPGSPPLDIDYTVHGPRAELVFVQPLLRGAGKRSAHAARRVAAADRDAQVAERDRAEQVLVHEVTVTYWELAYASRAVAIQESALALARDQLDITRARADVGKGSELEALAVEQAIAAREAALLGAQQNEIERALELRVLMAAEDGDSRRFAAADPLDGAVTVETDDALVRAIAQSPDLHVLAEHGRAAAVDREAAAGDLLPRLDLIVRGGPAGNSDDPGDAFSQLATFDSYAAQATLTFSIPLGNHLAKGRRDAARLREKRIGHAKDEVRGELTAAVQRALDAIELAERRITAASKAAELALRNVSLQQERWKAGSGTNFDVLERQDQLSAAEAALARARTDHRIAVAGLAYLTGE